MTGAGILSFLRSRLGIGLIAALALVLLAWAVAGWFDNKLDQARRDGRAAADREWQGAFSTMHGAALQWKSNFESAAQDLSTQRRMAYEKALARNAAAADGLRLSGPGAARANGCRSIDRPGSGAAASGSAPAAPRTDDPAGPLPAEDGPDQLAVVPWGWLTSRARDFDDLRDEVSTWRAWYPEQSELLRKARLQLPEPQLGEPK